MIFYCQGGLAEGDAWQAMSQSLTHEATKTVFEQGITWFSG